MTATAAKSRGENTRERILDAAEQLVLAQGYSGTSVDDILAATALTKGAFFYHFKSKADLARVLVERFWRRDFAMLEGFARQARDATDDPLRAVLLWFELFEQAVEGAGEAPVACLFASYLYEREQFDPDILDFIRDSFLAWAAMYETMFERVLRTRRPRVPVTAKELAEFAISVIEGSFVLGQSYREPQAVVRQSRQFRRYVEVMFAE